jgi:hypothetical protein
MFLSVQEDVHRLYAYTMLFYKRNLSIHRFCYPQGSWVKSLTDTEGWLYTLKCLYIYILRDDTVNLGEVYARVLCMVIPFLYVWNYFKIKRCKKASKKQALQPLVTKYILKCWGLEIWIFCYKYYITLYK